MNEIGERCAKWNKSEIERQILSDITDMWNLKRKENPQTHRSKEQTLVVTRAKEEWRWGVEDTDLH